VETEARQEIEATLAARRELGPGHDEHLIEGFLKRMESEIDRRVDDRVARTVPRARRRSALNPATLALFIPIIAVAGSQGGTPGVIAALAALVVIFLVSEFRR